VKKRRRFKQTTSLAQRLTQQAGHLRERAKTMPPGIEQSELLRRIRQAETALRIDEWLASPGSAPPNNAMAIMSGGRKEARRKPALR
jgi:hypothetical protein